MKRLFPPHARKLLGKVQDKKLAEDLGIAARTVNRERKRLGIPKPPRATPLTPAQKQRALSYPSVHAASRDLGLRERAVRELFEEKGRVVARSEPPPIPKQALRMLGKRPDAEIAAQFGIAPARIRHARSSQGIASYRDTNPEKVSKRAQMVLKNTELSVREVAEKLGIAEHKVTRLRSRLGVMVRAPRLTQKEISDASTLTVEQYAHKHNVDVKTARSRRARFAQGRIALS